MNHQFFVAAQEQQPDTLSVYWNGTQVLRIEDGNTVFDRKVTTEPGLLTIHFDGNPEPVYFAVAAAPT